MWRFRINPYYKWFEDNFHYKVTFTHPVKLYTNSYSKPAQGYNGRIQISCFIYSINYEVLYCEELCDPSKTSLKLSPSQNKTNNTQNNFNAKKRRSFRLNFVKRDLVKFKYLVLYFDQQSTMCQGASEEALIRSTRTRRGKIISTGWLRSTGCILHVMACTWKTARTPSPTLAHPPLPSLTSPLSPLSSLGALKASNMSPTTSPTGDQVNFIEHSCIKPSTNARTWASLLFHHHLK